VTSLGPGSLDLSLLLSLQNIKDKKKGLKRMVNSTHWEENLKQASTAVERMVYKFKVKFQFIF